MAPSSKRFKTSASQAGDPGSNPGGATIRKPEMFTTYTHPVTKEVYEYRFPHRLHELSLLREQILTFAKECEFDFILWNGWFYFKTSDAYSAVMLII